MVAAEEPRVRGDAWGDAPEQTLFQNKLLPRAKLGASLRFTRYW